MTEEKVKIGLLQQFNLIPAVLQRRVMVNLGVAIVVAAVSALLAVLCKTRGLLAGVLIAAYIAYLGIDILVGCRNGTIHRAKMTIVKASRVPMTKVVNLVLREENGTEDGGERFESRLETSRDNIGMLTAGTVLDVCYRDGTTTEILTWEIYG